MVPQTLSEAPYQQSVKQSELLTVSVIGPEKAAGTLKVNPLHALYVKDSDI